MNANGNKVSSRGEPFCKGIYAGCCIVPSFRCYPCERIASGKSTVEDELAKAAKRERLEARRAAISD